MTQYIIKADARVYLGLGDTTQFGEKLQTIVDGVNYDVSEYINDEPVDDRLKLACLRLTEYYWVKTAGAKSEGSSGAYKVQFEKSEGWPTDITSILDKYVEGGSDETGQSVLELI